MVQRENHSYQGKCSECQESIFQPITSKQLLNFTASPGERPIVSIVLDDELEVEMAHLYPESSECTSASSLVDSKVTGSLWRVGHSSDIKDELLVSCTPVIDFKTFVKNPSLVTNVHYLIGDLAIFKANYRIISMIVFIGTVTKGGHEVSLVPEVDFDLDTVTGWTCFDDDKKDPYKFDAESHSTNISILCVLLEKSNALNYHVTSQRASGTIARLKWKLACGVSQSTLSAWATHSVDGKAASALRLHIPNKLSPKCNEHAVEQKTRNSRKRKRDCPDCDAISTLFASTKEVPLLLDGSH